MRLSQRRVRSLLAVPIVLAFAASAALVPLRAQAATAPVKVAAGKILKTSKGFTLYVLAADSPNKSTCYSACAKFWPPYLMAAGSKPAAKMPGIPGTFGVAMRTDGTQQLTYDRAPLYTFVQDKDSGDAYGQGVVAFGGFWWVVVAAGK
jgi:predicted lipoprotein with Yx(FWY)xxD motif